MEVTPKPPPYCVVWPKLKAMLIGCAPSGGVNPPKVTAPPTGAVTAPVFEKVSGCGTPLGFATVALTGVPLTVIYTSTTLGAAVCTKYMVAGYDWPSESYTVVEVDWL